MSAALTSPINLRTRRAPSRVVFGPHETNLGRMRAISVKHAAYYARRARGGAGLIVTETASVHPSDWPYERAPLAADCAAGWSATAAACHAHGALVGASIGHSGLQGSSAFSQQALWAPSPVPDPATREMPMVMGQAQIELLVAGFAAAARTAAAAGLDGVEINAGQNSLLRQFHSGLTNLRDDDYGADRLLLTEEVLRAVRTALGPDLVLGLRLCCDELAPWAGVTPEAAAEQAARLAPLADYLVVVRGSIFSVSATRPDSHAEPGFNTETCRGVRAAVDGGAAVVLQGSVIDPDQAERVLTEGVADLVEMTRAQIAEPDLIAHCRAGQAGRARPCLLCNQACLARDARNPVVSCVIEPRSGHETTDPDTAGTDETRCHVLVVGGGPAGLEAARVLALRGHEVRLAERGPRLGGMLALAALLPGRAPLASALDWWQRELGRLGVSVQLDTEITTAGLDAAEAEGWRVVLATGSVPGPRRYLITADARVVEAADLLQLAQTGELTAWPAGPALVYDPVGGPVGVGVAELLAAAGWATSIVTQDQVAGTQLARTGDLADANTRLLRASVTRELRSLLREVGAGHAVLEDRWTGEQRTVDCALAVHCGHRLPDEALYLSRPGTPRAGDCVAPRTVHEAVLEGRRVAMVVGAGPGRPVMAAGQSVLAGRR